MKDNIQSIINNYNTLNYILLDTCINYTDYPLQKLYTGKVRDVYIKSNNELLIITSDRLSSFNRVLTTIPLKGIILNKISTWWFNKTKHIVPNHLIESYDRRMIVKKTKVFPIEFIMRGYLTGTTKTSICYNYNNGMRNYCGHILEDNLKKNQELHTPLLTPTTKDLDDTLISKEAIIQEKIMTSEQFNICKKYAEALFDFGQHIASEKGLILVDTKYEFGIDQNNNIILVDELHTPDSSRYWIKHSYYDKYNNNEEPETIDKDIIRKYVNNNYNDPYNDKIVITNTLRSETTIKYSQLYEIFISNFI